jgi:putative flippase GtrA
VSIRDGLLRELLLGARFGIVGVLATATHFAVLAAMLAVAQAGPVLSNTVAYLLALTVSFTGHHFWTFRTGAALLPSFLRFFGVSGGAFVVSTLLLVLMIRVVSLPDTLAAFLSAASIPAMTYAASRLWVFRHRRR